MATEFVSHGYQDLREYMQDNWNHIAVVDDVGNEVLRWEVDANANTSWQSNPVSNTLTAKLTVTGQDIIDAGGSLPVTIARTETYTTASSTARTTYDIFKNIKVQAANDEVIITHKYRSPK